MGRTTHEETRDADPVAARREHVESREPLHGVDGRAAERKGCQGGGRGRPADARRGPATRRGARVFAAASDPDHAARAGRDVDVVGSDIADVAIERTALRRAAGPEQAAHRGEVRGGRGERLAPPLWRWTT